MNFVRYVPIDAPAEEPLKAKTSQWSIGIAMFAAFVLPFVLFAASARYRIFVAQAKARIATIQNAQVMPAETLPAFAKQND